MSDNQPTIVLHEYVTPRIERLYPALLTRIATTYEAVSQERGENLTEYADQLVAFLKVSAYADVASNLDYQLVTAGDSAENIYAKFDVFSDTAHYEHFKRVLREVEARFEAPAADETRPLGERDDPN